MACPACGCKVTYQYNGEEFGPDDERLERCAACGAVFDIEDHTPENDDEPPEVAQTSKGEANYG